MKSMNLLCSWENKIPLSWMVLYNHQDLAREQQIMKNKQKIIDRIPNSIFILFLTSHLWMNATLIHYLPFTRYLG